MAVPSSGPLELRGDINLEVNGNVTDTNVALHQLSLDAGFSTPDAMSDFYGYSAVEAPSVVTKPVTSAAVSSQTLNGCVTNAGGENVSRGFYFGTNSSNATSNTKYTISGTQGAGDFSCGKSGLSQGTTYYNWAFACNSAGESVGNRCAANTGYPPYSPTLCETTLNSTLYFAPHSAYTPYDNTSFSPPYNCRLGMCVGYINPYSGGGTQTASLTSTQFTQQQTGNYHAKGDCNYGGAYYCLSYNMNNNLHSGAYLTGAMCARWNQPTSCMCSFGAKSESFSGGPDDGGGFHTTLCTSTRAACIKHNGASWHNFPSGITQFTYICAAANTRWCGY